MAERLIGRFGLDMPATRENLFSRRRVEPFATGETRRMTGSCNSLCQALSDIIRFCDFIRDGYFHDREIHGGIFPYVFDGFRMADAEFDGDPDLRIGMRQQYDCIRNETLWAHCTAIAFYFDILDFCHATGAGKE